MGVITLLSAKGSPGVTTTTAALATMWSHPVLVADADPSGGDMAVGWLGPWWADGSIRTDRGVVSFARSTRQLASVPSEGFVGHVQVVPGAPHVRLLAGVTSRAQAAAIGEEGWSRLASAARDLGRAGGPDVLIDAGRWVPGTPWPLIIEADLVLLAVRPNSRQIRAALPVARTLRGVVPVERLELAVCGATSPEAASVSELLDLRVGLRLPDEPSSAQVFSDGLRNSGRHSRRLPQTAYQAAKQLRTRFASDPQQPGLLPVPPSKRGDPR